MNRYPLLGHGCLGLWLGWLGQNFALKISPRGGRVHSIAGIGGEERGGDTNAAVAAAIYEGGDARASSGVGLLVDIGRDAERRIDGPDQTRPPIGIGCRRPLSPCACSPPRRRELKDIARSIRSRLVHWGFAPYFRFGIFPQHTA